LHQMSPLCPLLGMEYSKLRWVFEQTCSFVCFQLFVSLKSMYFGIYHYFCFLTALKIFKTQYMISMLANYWILILFFYFYFENFEYSCIHSVWRNQIESMYLLIAVVFFRFVIWLPGTISGPKSTVNWN